MSTASTNRIRDGLPEENVKPDWQAQVAQCQQAVSTLGPREPARSDAGRLRHRVRRGGNHWRTSGRPV